MWRSGHRSGGLRAAVGSPVFSRRGAGLISSIVVTTVTFLPAEAGSHGQQEGPSAPASSFEALRAGAERARDAGRLDEAIAAYREAVGLQPSWIEGHWYLGTIYYETERYRDCRDAFERVVSQQQENGAAWAFKGLCEFQLQNYDSALADLGRGRELGLGDSPELVTVARFHHAMLLTRAGQYERALQDLDGFARQGNTTGELTLALGLALMRMPRVPSEIAEPQRELVQGAGQAALLSLAGGREQAVRAVARLVEQHPDTPNVHYAYGLFLSLEHPDEALEQFRLELRISPDHAMARVQIGQELLKRAEHEAALPLATEAVRLAPDNFMARRLLGQLRLETGDVPGAIAELETAKRLQPESPSVRYQLARAYQRAKRTDDAARERADFTRLERELRTQRGGANAIGELPADEPKEPPQDDKYR
jgi:tetratricopeptide (TPR) repeat protein